MSSTMDGFRGALSPDDEAQVQADAAVKRAEEIQIAANITICWQDFLACAFLLACQAADRSFQLGARADFSGLNHMTDGLMLASKSALTLAVDRFKKMCDEEGKTDGKA